ncbi:MAG TPA: NUDIX domain-containing protein [Nitrosomonas sp.]|nr:NUDIX domain-containing protein [Nitrosomonas sp.]HMW20509.1 NUDIX domain-containing protein [Nitrosomonas sp.]HMW69820.1 NUDIX domain-containing protein [Nitrosomonas sp.]HMY62418.1 NUDIX domain-containing protein [Nitrosomonas sp.]HMY91154.1 NUDIX domain-containing protein [Nitrosomonas sp.]
MNKSDVEILEKKLCYQGFFRMERYALRHRLFNGTWSKPIVRELMERGHAAAVLPYDPVSDCVVMIEQFRIGAVSAPVGPWLLEIVAGIIERDEPAEQVVKREAVEEAGCTIHELIPLFDYLVSPGGTSERIALYCGRVEANHIVGGFYGIEDEGEDIKVHVMPFAEALSLLNTGKIAAASAIIALQWLALNRDSVRNRWLTA